ncbi:hypothetical protein WA158_007748 [Blastocystis sp. Blastoise]
MAPAPKQKFDYQFKILTLGDAAVGKTCLLLRYSSQTYVLTHIATIGVDFKIKNINIDGKAIKLQIWDTAGQDRFRTITVSYFRGANGMLLVYNITDKSSFQNVEMWMEQINKYAGDDVNIVLVGNKCDLESERQVSTQEGQNLANKYGIPFFETSAATGQNVNECFTKLARDCLNNNRNLPSPTPTPGPMPGRPNPNPVKNDCCK